MVESVLGLEWLFTFLTAHASSQQGSFIYVRKHACISSYVPLSFTSALFRSSSYEVHEADGVSMRDEILLFSLLCSAVYRDSRLRFHLCRRSVPGPLSIFNPPVQMVLRCGAQNSDVKNWVIIWIGYWMWIGVTPKLNETSSRWIPVSQK